ncbi:MAG TPA: SGNH/GDSL hydrolase family protein [Vicinamibacterales bacterium]|jgi:lysophospholipase L1-like esterase
MPLIAAYGDSTTAGTPGFRSPIEAPPSGAGNVESQFAYWLMRAHPEWRVVNHGVNGERADEIRVRFLRDIADAKPDAAIVLAGVNDIYQGRSAESVELELDTMYSAARASRIPIVAATIVPYNTATADANARMHAVNAWIRVYAAGHPAHMALADTRAAVAAAGDADRLVSSPDGLHPSPDGYRQMALALEPAIIRVLGER